MFRSWVSVGPGRDLKHFFKEEGWVVGWGMAGAEGWFGKVGRVEHQRGTNRGAKGAWLTGSRMPQFGSTPLHLAAERGRAAVVGALLAAKADKEAKTRVRGQGGCRASRGRVGVVWALDRLVVLV